MNDATRLLHIRKLLPSTGEDLLRGSMGQGRILGSELQILNFYALLRELYAKALTLCGSEAITLTYGYSQLKTEMS